MPANEKLDVIGAKVIAIFFESVKTYGIAELKSN